jgi:hypothetical protein
MTDCVTRKSAMNGCASDWRPEAGTANPHHTAMRLAVLVVGQVGNKGSKAMASEMPNRAISVEVATAAVTVSSSLR